VRVFVICYLYFWVLNIIKKNIMSWTEK